MANRIEDFLKLMESFDCVDLTHTMEEKMPTFPGHAKFFLNQWVSPGDPAFLNMMITGDHTGTHFDAPAHFLHDEGNPVRKLCHEVDPLSLTGHAVKLTFGPFPAENCTISAEDIKAWEKANVEVKPDDIVIFDYQWSRDKWTTVDKSNAVMESWPGLSESAVNYLLEKGIRVAGTDCASIDSADGDGFKFPGHLSMLCKGVLVLENLKNLHLLPNEFIFMALPLKIKNAGGSPVRAVALVPRD